MRWLTSIWAVLFSSSMALSQWQSVYPVVPEGTDVAVVSPDHVFLVGEKDFNQGWLLSSSDGGRTWRRFELTASPLSVYFADSLTGFIASAGSVLKTMDGARTWQSKPLPPGFPTPMEIHFTSATVGYVRAANNRMAKTTDGGASCSTTQGELNHSTLLGRQPCFLNWPGRLLEIT